MKLNSIVAALGLVTLVGCGAGIKDGEFEGQPIAILHARTTGALSTDMPVDATRGAFVWLDMKALNDCMMATNDLFVFLDCYVTAPLGAVATDAPIESTLPVTFDLPIYDVPQDGLLVSQFGYFGMGTVIMYNDGNGNAQPDMVDPESLNAGPDTVLGVQDTAASGFVLYLQGQLPPLYLMYAAMGCPEPPQGFSILSLPHAHGEPCTVFGLDNVLKVQLVDNADAGQLLCEGPVTPRKVDAPQVAPDGLATAQCSTDGTKLAIDQHPERYCVAANSVTYQLTDFYNLPAWWPCQVTPPNSDPRTLVGTYSVDSHTLNDTACDAEGPAQDGPAYIEATLISPLGLVSFHGCSSLTSCDQSIFSVGWDGTTWKSTIRAAISGSGTCEAFRDEELAVTDHGATIRLEKRRFSASIQLRADEVCDLSVLDSHASEIVCTSYEVYTGTRVDNP